MEHVDCIRRQTVIFLSFPLLMHTHMHTKENCFIMEPLQLNWLSLCNKWASLGTAVATLQAQGTFCDEDSVNINGFLGCFSLIKGTLL